jgi:SAM-dependent methyltransferase
VSNPSVETTLAVGTYDALALEYYDRDRHPTCATFREGSGLLLRKQLSNLWRRTSRVWEVGCGRSIAAEWLSSHNHALTRLTLVDSSASMLEHSSGWAEQGARLLEADATHLPARDLSVDLLVASLGDPYNTKEFWAETFRVLSPQGVCVFTTPSSEWARAFRSHQPGGRARFALEDGSTVEVPSVILPEASQARLAAREGLSLTAVDHAPLASLRTSHSPKLRLTRPCDPVVTGYVFRRSVADT